MTDFTVHTVEIAPVEAKPRLQGAQDALGFVPNLYATMAEAPTSRLNEKMGLRLQTKIYLLDLHLRASRRLDRLPLSAANNNQAFLRP